MLCCVVHRKQMQEAVNDAKEQLTLETDEAKRAHLTSLIKEREAAVDELLDRYSHAALEAAQRVRMQLCHMHFQGVASKAHQGAVACF